MDWQAHTFIVSHKSGSCLMTLRADWLPALAAFESAARHQNFAHAAEELHLTASAVSHHVRKLETRLGLSLFRRHARGVVLTAEGRQLADAASSALSDVEGTLLGLRAGRDEEHRVRITSLHSLVHTWLLPRLARFAHRHPTLRLSFDTSASLARFEDGGVDLGIRHGPGNWSGLNALHLMDEHLFPVASPRMPGIERVRSATDVARLPLISDLARQGWQDWFRAAKVHGTTPDERFNFSDSTDALEAAALGLGATLARERILAPWLSDRRLIALPGPRIPARWSYHIVHPSHRPLRAPARAFVEWLLDDLREHGG
jgi:LysR family glycine cleavage system transcriptional activator